MKQLNYIIHLILLLGFLSSCNQSKKTEPEFEEYVFGVRLVKDSALVEKYLDYHGNIWPEVVAGFRKAGYEHIRLYRFENHITMIVKVPKGSDLGKMGQICNDSHPKVDEWNRLMDSFQKGLPGTAKGQTWVEMEKYYEFKN